MLPWLMLPPDSCCPREGRLQPRPRLPLRLLPLLSLLPGGGGGGGRRHEDPGHHRGRAQEGSEQGLAEAGGGGGGRGQEEQGPAPPQYTGLPGETACRGLTRLGLIDKFPNQELIIYSLFGNAELHFPA